MKRSPRLPPAYRKPLEGLCRKFSAGPSCKAFAPLTLSGALALTSLAGCHSAFVEATLVNRTDKPLRLVEVDYPSASFGTQNLAPGAPFHYRFKLIGEGPVKLSWTDDLQKEHTAEGPALHEGQGGSLTITIAPGQTAWQTTLTH